VASFDEPDDVHTLVFGAILVGIFGLALGGLAALAAAPITIPLPCGDRAVCRGWLWASAQRRAWSF